jgi:hypothetical protein
VRTFLYKIPVAHPLHPPLCNGIDPFHIVLSGAGF